MPKGRIPQKGDRMMWLDKILNFLFRTRAGKLVLVGGFAASAFLFGGCLLPDALSCMCDGCGCSGCADCWADCDDECNDCGMECFGGDDCASTSCLFGDGCVSACGSCVIDCGGCNSTMCTESSCDLSGCGTSCEASCLNCDLSCDGAKRLVTKPMSIKIEYIEFHGDEKIGPLTTSSSYYNSNGGYFDFDNNHNNNYGSYYDPWADSQQTIVYEDFKHDVTVTGGTSYKKRQIVRQLSYTVTPAGYTTGAFYRDEECTKAVTDEAGRLLDNVNINDLGGKTIYCKVTETSYGTTRFFNTTVVDDKGNKIDGAPEIPTVQATVGSTMAIVPQPVNIPGYKFLYFELPNGHRAKRDAVKPNMIFHLKEWGGTDEATIELKAVYTPMTINVTFHVGSQTYGPIDAEYGTILSAMLSQLNSKYEVFVEEGRSIVGWSYNQNSEELIELYEGLETEDENGAVHLYAVIKDYMYLTFHNIHGPRDATTVVTSKKYYEGDSFDQATLKSLSGLQDEIKVEETTVYTFEGWYLDPTLSNALSGEFQISDAHKDLYAKWTVSTFTIRYHIGKNVTVTGTYQYDPYKAFEITMQPTQDQIPEGCTFNGWYKDADFVDGPVQEIPAGTCGQVELYAAFFGQNVTLYLVAGSGVQLDRTEVTVRYGASFDLPVPTRTGYDFTGWYFRDGESLITDGSGHSRFALTKENFYTNKIVSLDQFLHDPIQLTPQWTEHLYTVKFVADTGNGPETWATVQKKHNEQIGTVGQLSDPPEKAGYDFKGWFSGDVQYSAETVVTQDITFTAKFEPKVYTITLYGNGGQVNGKDQDTVDVTYNTQPQLPVPTHESLSFDGWFIKGTSTRVTLANGKFTGLFTYTGTAPYELEAHWF